MAETGSLRSLADQPFALLAEMERRARAVRVGQEADAETGREWVGVAFRLEDNQFLAPRDDVREVLLIPSVTRIPGARSWVKGLANLRGQLLPLTDLRAFLRADSRPVVRNARVLAVNHKQIPAGLIVDEVIGFRRFVETERRAAPPAPIAGVEEYLTGAFVRGDQTWPVLSLRKLVESEQFLNAAAG